MLLVLRAILGERRHHRHEPGAQGGGDGRGTAAPRHRSGRGKLRHEPVEGQVTEARRFGGVHARIVRLRQGCEPAWAQPAMSAPGGRGTGAPARSFRRIAAVGTGRSMVGIGHEAADAGIAGSAGSLTHLGCARSPARRRLGLDDRVANTDWVTEPPMPVLPAPQGPRVRPRVGAPGRDRSPSSAGIDAGRRARVEPAAYRLQRASADR